MRNSEQTETVVLIPAYKPEQHLVKLIQDLHALGQRDIIVVDDGSGKEFDSIFAEISSQCTVLRHAVNCGKGRALKTGFNYFLLNYPNAVGVVTADADGQHRPEDIIKIAGLLKKERNKMILGVREFGSGVPLRSKIGNILTKYVFFVMVGLKISDTQTGLRGIPVQLIPKLLTITHDRYEYETSMLIVNRELNLSVIEEPIETVYIEQNRSSHFNPILDSLRIYFLIIRFSVSSILASIIDSAVFLLCFWLGGEILFSIICARFVAGTFNYIFNKKIVFQTSGSYLKFIKYWLLVIILGVLAYYMINGLYHATNINIVIIKIFIELFLFIMSFIIQRFWIFSSPAEEYVEAENS
ncbi:MAG: bifunctional glycosyltransferase family 2/GtrA family protein [Victivallaceae bacterium]|nr:bifunctional glycosyltransferase family 2/GtrA family protein [Victivallaceae bacterium]